MQVAGLAPGWLRRRGSGTAFNSHLVAAASYHKTRADDRTALLIAPWKQRQHRLSCSSPAVSVGSWDRDGEAQEAPWAAWSRVLPQRGPWPYAMNKGT